LPKEYGVHHTFNIIIPFARSKEEEEEDAWDLRTNPFQKGGDDGRGPSPSPNTSSSPKHRRFGLTTRVMARRIQ